LIAEGAVGDMIYLNCQSIFNYAAGARSASLSGHTDWRVPNTFETLSLSDEEAPTGYPNAIAFPVWPAYTWASTTQPDAVANAHFGHWARGYIFSAGKATSTCHTVLVRLGV